MPPFARSSAIEALRSATERIAFIDDDEVADRGWQKALMIVAGSAKSDALHSRTSYNYPPHGKLRIAL